MGYVQYDNLGDSGKRTKGWDFKDAVYFAHFLKDNELKTAIQNIIWYWDGQINGRTLLSGLKLPLPVPPEEDKQENP